MPETAHSLRVAGTVALDSHGAILVLSERLDGHDTFLTGQLQLGDTPPIAVRILTFDDVTVLRVLGHSLPPTGPWSGILHLPHGWRTRSIPADLASAATAAKRDLLALDEAELRYALTFLGEASTHAIREMRIDAIVSALPLPDAAA
ncbi:MAG TPA: hypothetical protein VGS19_38705 [Streptosporangiaceae bacterium]|nr:hypothetical protein [Streptosporangiaceae bacterium]